MKPELSPQAVELETLPLRIAIEMHERGLMDDRTLLAMSRAAAKRLARLGLLERRET